ncbi:HrpE/YscL family type III secretion apparatus protein [Trinickia dabaoshanensis]|uniref:Type 3 secretion system stator protein n=1 Tax=Trinickia dabaoshanensis TaxID=564714 RepID=A0A2N7VY15_9BURK|nr:type III secretion system stator protein SctL [Trinickia dabaoshanensis]PMS22045.1 HrpE/YscL family type III secretion apparatus protein [Trinickia dabaoshanensis]
MAIWLKQQPKVIAIDSDVVRAGEFARTMELNDAMQALDEVVHATMHDANKRAEHLVETARRETQALAAAARRNFEKSARLGYAAGQRRALAEAHAELLARARDEREELHAQSARLARLVMSAVEQVIAESDRDALMRRVAAAVSRAIDDASHLSVIVSQAEAESARRAFGALAREANPPLNVEVLVDDAIDEGCCVCEWDYGVIEGNLRAQLAGLERALKGAVMSASGVPAADGLPQGEWEDDAFDDEDE